VGAFWRFIEIAM